jgi:dihydrofolate reductase
VNAGLIDEFSIALSPVLFGSGIRLFEGVAAGRVALSPVRAEPTQRVTHLTTQSGSGNCLDLSAPAEVSSALRSSTL